MTEDRFATFDAAYVLGALSPEDRQAYEQHLRECADCARAVQELAGVPGLLGKVPEEMATAEHGDAEPPATLLPNLLRRAGHTRRRRRVLTVGAVAWAAAACLALILVLTLRIGAGTASVAEPTTSMTPLAPIPVHATIGLQGTDDGTQVTMHCMYDERRDGQRRFYRLVLINADGRVERVASWWIGPGEDARFRGSTPWHMRDIEAAEIRTGSGQPLLRATP